jgi:hypothetical protein
MVQLRESDAGEVTERDMRHSGIPAPGKLGAAKKQVWALAFGLFVLALIVIAAIIDTQV